MLVYVIYGLVMPQNLHMSEYLELVPAAFKWLTWWGFLLGLIFNLIYHFLHRKQGPQENLNARWKLELDVRDDKHDRERHLPAYARVSDGHYQTFVAIQRRGVTCHDGRIA